jgi:adenylate cyclase
VCGGIGKCSTCRVVVLEGLGQCLPRNQVEARMARLKGFSPEIRLACQTRVLGPVVLKRLVHDETDVHDAADMGSDYAGRETPLAVMFVDIKGFTCFAESNLPYDVDHALNRYFDVVGKAVDAYGGYIDKYIGDGVMVLFGLDRARNTHPCVDAVAAAFDTLSGMGAVNSYLEAHLDRTFQLAIGIHYGHAVVGEVGYKLKRQFTAVGDVVNTAARLEDEAKKQGVGLLVTEEVLRELPAGMCTVGFRTTHAQRQVGPDRPRLLGSRRRPREARTRDEPHRAKGVVADPFTPVPVRQAGYAELDPPKTQNVTSGRWFQFSFK